MNEGIFMANGLVSAHTTQEQTAVGLSVQEDLLKLSDTSDDVSPVWQRCLDDLRYEIDEAEFKQWILPLKAYEDKQKLVLLAINRFFVTRIHKNYLALIKELVKKHSQDSIDEVVVTHSHPSAFDSKDTENKPIKKSAPTQQAQSQKSVQLNPSYTFDAFVKGKSNALAYNTCYEMAKKAQNSSYASLFIYGSSGLGKTHLMQSVAHRYQKAGRAFCYFSSDTLMNEIGKALFNKKILEFQESVLSAELLIVDDIHAIKSKDKPKLAEIFINLYDGFIQSGKRVILASDKPPMDMEGFDSRFLSRFAEGLTVVIDPPEIETRVNILEKKAAVLQLELPKECAIFIAQNTPPDVRHLEGALKKVHAHATMLGEAVDLSLIRKALKNHLIARARSINGDNIKDMVAEYYGVSVKELVGKKRARHIARPRQMAMALMREFTDDSFPDIGQAFGGRDHTTVMHACEKVAELRQEDPVFDKDYQALASTLQFN